MQCLHCGHPKTHKHGKMPNAHQCYFCPNCKQTFAESFDTLYYYRHISPQQIEQVLPAHSEGSSLRGISHIPGLADNTVLSVIRSASSRALLIHNTFTQYGAIAALEESQDCIEEMRQAFAEHRQVMYDLLNAIWCFLPSKYQQNSFKITRIL